MKRNKYRILQKFCTSIKTILFTIKLFIKRLRCVKRAFHGWSTNEFSCMNNTTVPNNFFNLSALTAMKFTAARS